VNLSSVLKDFGSAPLATNEWGHIFAGTTTPIKMAGRYGSDGVPPGIPGGIPGNSANPYVGSSYPFPAGQVGLFPPISGKGYSKVNFDEGNSSGTPPAITRTTIPTAFTPSTTAGYFPPYQAGTGYQTQPTTTALTNHPFAYSPFGNIGDDRGFSLNNMEALLRYNDTTSYSLTSDLFTLCPNVFGPASQQRARNLVTTRAFDIDVPGLAPAFASRSGAYKLDTSVTPPKIRPEAGAAVFPSAASIPSSPNSDFALNDGRMSFTQPSLAAGLVYTLSKRLDLNRPLPDYPQPVNGVMSSTDVKFYAAQQARQDLATDIFAYLRLVTGADDPSTVSVAIEKDALRWLAQLSVNIVDFIDNDDIMTPFYWNPPSTTDVVYGTELPKLLINEVVVQYKNPPGGPQTLVDVWVELMNPGNQDATLLPDSGGVRVGNGSFNPYQVAVCTSGSYGTLTKPANTAGVPDINFNPSATPPSLIQTTTTGGTTACQVAAEFNTLTTTQIVLPYNGGNPAGQGFFVLGPTTPITTTGATGITTALTSTNLSYKLSPQQTQPLAPTIILQRLACPYMQTSPANPYITVDIFQNACNFSNTEGPLQNNVANPQTNSDCRPNPFMNHLANSNVRGKDTTNGSGTIKNSFGSLNYNETGATNQWLVHLDRPLSSPMELLHVSGFKPEELTQYFGDTTIAQMGQFNHRVPWFDEDLGGSTTSSHRLYRFFEVVETRSRMAGMDPAIFRPSSAILAQAGAISLPSLTTITSNGNVVTIGIGDILTIMGTDANGATVMENVRVSGPSSSGVSLVRGTFSATPYQTINNPILIHTATGGRVAGKINVNSVFDVEVFRALADPNAANAFASGVDTIFGTGLPSPSGIVGALHPSYTITNGALSVNWAGFSADQPFNGMGMAQFVSSGAADLLQLSPASSGVNRSYFRPASALPFAGLFEPAAPVGGQSSHPYTRFELLNKIYNNTTSRSNVFAVWLTVGFFECDANGNNLGPEVGKSEGKHTRHRMFAIVDRTGLAVPRQVGALDQPDTAPPAPPYVNYATGASVRLVLAGGQATSTSGVTVGTQLLVGNPGSNMETVTVQAMTANRITVTFTQVHSPGEPVYIAPGNWGPQPGFDVTQPVNKEIVPYYSIIE
jgi:hypothetical protein